MKKSISIIAVASLMFAAYAKKPVNGTNGVQGVAGQNGVGNTEIIIVKNVSLFHKVVYSSAWSEAVYADTILVPAITQEIVNSGNVIVYLQNLQAIPNGYPVDTVQ
jgi:hypothetical protein